MHKATMEQLGSFSVNVGTEQEALSKRLRHLEQENANSRLAAQDDIHKCEALYQAMLETVDAYMILVDREQTVLWANQKAKGLFGHDIVGRSYCTELYGKKAPCDDASSHLTSWPFNNGSTGKSHSMKLTGKDGIKRYFEGTATVVSHDNAGQPSVVAKTYKDVTKRKLAEEEIRNNMKQMRRSLNGTIQAIARTFETKDAYTAAHQRRTSEIARAIAYEMGLSKDMIDAIRMAGVIHDLGKIAVPAEILSKPGKLSDSEMSLIKQHPQSGYEILKDIDCKWPVADIVLQHHEKLDGSGYPNKLSGNQIFLEARIIGVADVIEAMASHRPYRPALGIDDAFEEITMKRGILYDPDVVDASIDLFTERGFQLN